MTTPTRVSLLNRMKNLEDQVSWRDFFETYWKLIYSVAIKAGLTDAEAQDVVQETIIAVARKIPQFRYEAGKDSFKGWLLQITRWKIADQYRRRPPVDRPQEIRRTAFLERIPNPAGTDLDAIWDAEWERNLLKTALKRVKRQITPQHYEIFKLYAIDHQPVSTVAQSMSVPEGQVYLVKNRVSLLLKKEIKHLETKLI